MPKTIMTLAIDDSVAFDLALHLPGSRILNTTEIENTSTDFNISGGEGRKGPALTSEQAENIMDREGNVTVVILLDQENYFSHFVASATDESSSPESYAHSVAFAIGKPFEATAEIIGASGADFIVSYTTHIREFLDD